MKWFKKKQPPARVQLRETPRHPFGVLDAYAPPWNGEFGLYRSIREALPIIDAAVGKLIRLTGGFQVHVPAGQKELSEFLQRVNTGRGQRGIRSFLDAYLDDLLICGRGVGEIVLTRDRRDIAAVLCADPERIELQEGKTPLEFALCVRDEDGKLIKPAAQELLLFTPFQPDAKHPYGASLLRSMPFLTGILLKIYQAVGCNWERMGNARFAVVYKPGSGEGAWARERAGEIARSWSETMQAGRDGSMRDFVAVGDVDIKVIGADNQILDSEVPVRQILEQLVSKTGIPPFLLGLSWSSTERMSAQQADMLTSEINALRRTVTPVIERVCETWLRIHGYSTSQIRVEWEKINLQDLVEEAKAELYHRQALRLDRKPSEPENKHNTKEETHGTGSAKAD